MKKIKYIDIKEFREKGYLQELNRQFLHPLGLALEIKREKDGSEKLGGIWDYRDDLEGIAYDLKNSDEDRIERFKRNHFNIDRERRIRSRLRKQLLGFIVEPIPKKL